MTSRKPASGGFEVGYGRPPRDRQFKPGQSGNPKGRPKKVKADGRDLGRLLDEVMSKLVPLVENGKRRRVPIAQALILKQATLAMQGNQQAFRTLMRLLERFPPVSSSQDEGTPIDYGAEVRRKLDEMASRMMEQQAGEGSGQQEDAAGTRRSLGGIASK